MGVENLSINLEAKLVPDEELKQNIENFTVALKRLPKDINVKIAIGIDGKFSDSALQINLADILIEQVKNHFNEN